MRAYASGIAVVGTTRQRDGLKFPNYPDEKMKERLREEGQVPIIQQREVMPFRVVQSTPVELGAPRTVLQVMVMVMAARSAIAQVGGSTIHRSAFMPVSVTRGLERDRTTGAAEPEYKSKRGYTVHAPKAMAGHPIRDMTSMKSEKVQEILGAMTKEQLEVKIQQANTVIQTYKSQLDGYESDDVARRERATSERAWRTTLRLIETEEALQSVTQQETGRPLPSWIRDIAGGLDGREGFRALKEAVVGMQRELEELRTRAANAPAAPTAPPAASAAAVHEDAAMPAPEEAYTEAAGAIEQRDWMMASVIRMTEELEVEREKRQRELTKRGARERNSRGRSGR